MPSPRRPRPASISPSQASHLSLSPAITAHSRSSSGSSSIQLHVPIQLHYWLCKTQEVVANDIRGHILWDIREHPRNAQAVQALPLPLHPEVLNAYATYPPVSYLNVTCEFPRRWSTVVYASAGGASPSGTMPASAYPVSPHALPSPVIGVTVADVLAAIYNHLNTEPISTFDFNALQPKQQTRVLEAYEKRQKTAQSGGNLQSHLASASAHVSAFTLPHASSTRSNTASTGGSVARESVKLVDTFLLHTMFAGLEVDPDTPNTVNLSVKRPN